ncbi:pilus assembly protein [Hyalangium versicolor]|uniref:pilus assembly protein n=1 Tax=Hyalangium versicolor TaxID=2861190 RepID=UPI001CCDBB5F|nr:pilus assembly protein PilY [Hyalangium versicolor]
MHSWTPHLRRFCLGLAVLGTAGVAYAQLGNSTSNSPACCQLTTSLVNDVIRGKDATGDERFFSTEGAPPNIHFLVDASGSMRELPQVINSGHVEFFNLTTNGCTNVRLDTFEASRGWDPTFQYPVPDPGTGLGADLGFPNLFQDAKFYGYMYWNDSSDPTPQWNSKEEACKSQVPNWNTSRTADYNKCLSCLSTKGFYKLPEATARDTAPLTNLDFIFWGRFLNFNPPKYVTAKAVLKSVIKDLKRVRAGISIFAPNSNPFLSEMLQPQNPSCSEILSDASAFDNNRASYINSVNTLTFSTGTPLAKALLNTGYYFTSSDDIYRVKFNFGTNYNYPPEFKNTLLNSPGRSVCWGCQTSSVIIITDGEPSGDSMSAQMADRLRTVNGGPVYCPDAMPCQSGTALSTRDKGANVTNVLDDNPNYYLDDVAQMLYKKDLQENMPAQVNDFNTTGQQNIITYTVGFGINSNLLKNTADVGGGLYYTAEDAASLKQALLDIINNVQTRATSFSSAAATSLQSGDTSTTIIPRFKPSRAKTEPWQGFLYRFNLSTESLVGCDPAQPTAGGDLNHDGDCDDTVLLDAADDPVVENDDGDYVKLLSPTLPAQPFWEAGKVLKPSAANSTRWKTRRIYTIVDNDADYNNSKGDGLIDFRDTPVEFSEANASKLRDFLGISQNTAACADLAVKLGVPSLSPDDCAKLVIRWYRGADALNNDPALRDYDRPFLLGDIFHSSPIQVEPPIPRAFCNFSNQCIQTLFSGATLLQNDYTTPDNTGVNAYDKYVYEAGNRDKVILVGANDGMLHAFHNGQSTEEFDKLTHERKYDAGTGQELWAFIPPDLLPKLRPNIGRHTYFVDGTAMVRNVWADGLEGQDKDGKKQWQEYRTVAVVGSGRGGVHRFALDLTRVLGRNPGDTASLAPSQKGDFLWTWPQPCDALAVQVGESFTNFAPRPPPIGPVALSPGADDSLRSLYGEGASPASPYLINGKAARERYVVFLNGGFDQTLTRGRGMAVVDIRTGHTLWSYFYKDGKGRSDHLRYPIAAGVVPMDVGLADNPSGDGDFLWDTAQVGDYGGQLWTVRFWDPGTWNSSTKQMDNWFAARAFRVANLSGKSGDAEAIRAPFTYMALVTRQPETGYIRTFMGTGDKETLMDKGSVCRLSTPGSCAAQGCGVNNTLTVERGGTMFYKSSTNFQNYHHVTGESTEYSPVGNACGGVRVTLAWDNTAANGCGNANDGSIQYKCDGTSTSWNCAETNNSWVALSYPQTTSAYPQRYYGIYTYGGTDPARKFNSETEAANYDSHLYTDSDLTNVSQFDSTGNVVTASQVSASPSGKGWYIEYALANERTGSTGVLSSGCVLWGSFEPSGASGAVCATTGTNAARLYQANYTTGMADCALGFYNKGNDQWARYMTSETGTPPSEPMLQISVTGGRGVIQQTPGSDPRRTETEENRDLGKSVYQLILDRRGHDCRHGGVNCN